MLNARKRNFLNSRLVAPLYISIVMLVALLLLKEGLSIFVDIHKSQALHEVNHRSQIRREGERLLGAALEEKVALRGYLLTGTPFLLENYWAGAAEFADRLQDLSKLVRDDPIQLKHLSEIEIFYQQWQEQFAQKVLKQEVLGSTLVENSSLDDLRTAVNSILVHEKRLLAIQNQRLAQLNRIAIGLSIFNALVVLMGAGITIGLMRKRIEVPLKRLTQVSQRWRTGQVKDQMDYSAPDEIGQLTEVLDSMSVEVRHRQERVQLRTQQLQELISTLSHDLRTPLLATRTTLDATLGGAFGPMTGLLKDVLGEYRDANSDLIRMVEGLLDISRYETGDKRNQNRELLSWEKLFDRVTFQAQAASKRKCRLTYEVEPALPAVYGDQIEIQRVLQNLIDNAIRLSQPRKLVHLAVKTLDANHVKVCVEDQGPGISASEQGQLFYRFVKGAGRQGKLGLGLYLCRQIVATHGGSIHVDSRLGKGSTFWFTLPINFCQLKQDDLFEISQKEISSAETFSMPVSPDEPLESLSRPPLQIDSPDLSPMPEPQIH
ncbi:MAG: HAMP domain-containing protein [Cyanothece sp. SIO1E1]|nr:HAMP domain-containing protein [Cyanothece sp. SIO1E1]